MGAVVPLFRPSQVKTPGMIIFRPEAAQAMPSNWCSIHKNDLARTMVARTERAFLAIAQGNAPKKPTVKILEYKAMAPFFVKAATDRTSETS